MVRTKGTMIAVSIASRKFTQYSGKMDRMPGRPPTPMEIAVTPVPIEIIAAQAEPIMPHTSGNTYFMLTPNSAGSVTPR